MLSHASPNRRGVTGLVFIDGMHLYDFTLLDFSMLIYLCILVDLLCLMMSMPSVQKVIAYISTEPK